MAVLQQRAMRGENCVVYSQETGDGETMKNRFRVVNSAADMAKRLSEIEAASFSSIGDDYLIRPEQFQAHIAAFPEGQHAVIDENGVPVASSSDLRMDIDLTDKTALQRSCLEMSGNNWMTTHDPQGQWLYGFSISVHPDFQGKGLSGMLYRARQNLVRRLNLRGHLAGGNLRGFHKYKAAMDAKTYIENVAAGNIHDPALSAQLKRGFRVIDIIDNFTQDPECDNKAAFIVWDNKDYRS